MSGDMERCPTTGKECLTLSLLVEFQESFLGCTEEDDLKLKERLELEQMTISGLVKSAQDFCEGDSCAVMAAGSAVAYLVHTRQLTDRLSG